MNDQLMLSASIAGVLHAVVLFGFNHTGLNDRHPVEDDDQLETLILTSMPAIEMQPPEEVMVESNDASADSVNAPPASAPVRRPERFVQRLEDTRRFVQVPQPHLPPTEIDITTVIPRNWGESGEPEGNGSGGWQGTLASMLDEIPQATYRTSPSYPYELRRAGVDGPVEIAFWVDADGTVLSAKVVRADQPEFGASALKAVTRWRFTRGTRDGQPVRYRMTIPIVFNIQ